MTRRFSSFVLPGVQVQPATYGLAVVTSDSRFSRSRSEEDASDLDIQQFQKELRLALREVAATNE